MSEQYPDAEQVTDPQRISAAEQTPQTHTSATEQDTPVAPAPNADTPANDAAQEAPKAPRARRRSASRPAGPPAQAPVPPAANVAAPEQNSPTEQNAPSEPEATSEPTPVKQPARRPARKRVTRAQAPAEAKIEVETTAPTPDVADGADSDVVEAAPQEDRAPSAAAHSDIPNPFARNPFATHPAPATDAPEEEQKTTRSRRRPTKRVADPFAAPEAVPAQRKTETTQPAWDADEAPQDDDTTTVAASTALPNHEQSTQPQPVGQAEDDESDGNESSSDESERNDSENNGPDSNDSGNDDSDNSDDPNRRRRRRRGGRRRRRGGESDNNSGDDSEDSSEDSEQPDSEQSDSEQSGSGSGGGRGRGGRQSGGRSNASDSEKSDDQPAAEGETDAHRGPSSEGESGESTSGRRRRRRRRRGEDDSATSEDDPADVVTRVREPRNRRNPSDEVTGISGSTRMEAKRQRRRDGRTASRRRSPILSESEFLSRRESVDRKLVIRQSEGLAQLAVIEDGSLVEHYVDRDSAASLIGNVYLGRVQNVLPSMEAAFIDIGRGRNAVLYAGEVDWDSFGVNGKSRQVEKVLKSGQTILVQVTKDPVGAKGARLTNHVSIPGRYIVYAPGGHLSGISRKLPENERRRLKDILGGLVEENASFIVRTAAEGATEEELVRDVNRLKAQWEAIEKLIKGGQSPQQLYSEPDLTVRIVRDLFTEDFSELIISGNQGGNDAYDTVDAYVAHVAPHLKERMTRWDETDGDVFSAFRLNEQIAKGLERKVFLPSGGSLVIDRTEAMTVVDVNTGKFTGSGGNLEATVTSNNLEAAEEVIRQLRLRDIGGIIVIDFIDMVLPTNRELLLRRLVECLGRDRTRHQVAEVTSLGLVQMTRKKIGTGLAEAFTEPCECCDARGYKTFDMPVDSQDHADGGQRSSRGGRRGGGNGGNRGGGQNSGNQNSGNQSSGNQGQGRQDPPKPGDHRVSRSNGSAQNPASSEDAAAEDTGNAVTAEADSADKPSEGKQKSGKAKSDKPKSDKPKSDKPKSDKPKSGKSKSKPKKAKPDETPEDQAPAAQPSAAPSDEARSGEAGAAEAGAGEAGAAEAGSGEAGSGEAQSSHGQAVESQASEETAVKTPAPRKRASRARRAPRAASADTESAQLPIDHPQESAPDNS